MKQEVLDFYAERGIHVGKMVDVGARKNLTADSVMKAAEEVYDEIQSGLQLEQVRIAWRVYSKAYHIAPIQKIENVQTIMEIKDLLIAFYAEYKTPWYIKLWRKIK